MTEPIVKKSGYQNRRSKARKLQDQRILLNKTKSIQSFFPSKTAVVDIIDNEPKQESSTSTDDLNNNPCEAGSDLPDDDGNCILR